MMRNNVGEWDVTKRGDFNYVTNGKNVRDYWAERLKEVARYQNLYTIGMRGIHDGSILCFNLSIMVLYYESTV